MLFPALRNWESVPPSAGPIKLLRLLMKSSEPIIRTRQPLDFVVNAFEKPRLYQVSPNTDFACCINGGNIDMH